ncbi:hypothetical protein FCM35_KLT04809 [Carex littledalei]|uniref:Gamma-butyrobetaine hydroxylase-like N-terminal domain-containing protein n=1 Tax=Carex littledalei TaxID=544730 RepID=A0A833QWN2_9POAL|nr:hypothetical protein FCM35_KLT04809 [Carex littledalei]
MSAWVLRSALRRLHNSAPSKTLPPRLTKFALHPPKAVEVEFSDGTSFNLSSEFLRVHSPAADSKIRSVGGEKVIFGRRHVGIMSAEQVGNYGVRILFDDLHKTGIFTWDYLHHLGANKVSLMRNYIKTLKTHGLSRDPRVKSN